MTGPANPDQRLSWCQTNGLAQRLDGIAGTPALKQELPLDFMQKRISRPIFDQRIDARQKSFETRLFIMGNRSCITSRKAFVTPAIHIENGARLVEKSNELGLDHIMAKLQLRRVEPAENREIVGPGPAIVQYVGAAMDGSADRDLPDAWTPGSDP